MSEEEDSGPQGSQPESLFPTAPRQTGASGPSSKHTTRSTVDFVDSAEATEDGELKDFLKGLYEAMGLKVDLAAVTFGGCDPTVGDKRMIKAANVYIAKYKLEDKVTDQESMLSFILGGSSKDKFTITYMGKPASINVKRCVGVAALCLKPLKKTFIYLPTFTTRNRKGLIKYTNMRCGVRMCTIQGWTSLGHRPPLTSFSQKALWVICYRSVMRMGQTNGHGLVGTLRTNGMSVEDPKKIPKFAKEVNGVEEAVTYEEMDLATY